MSGLEDLGCDRGITSLGKGGGYEGHSAKLWGKLLPGILASHQLPPVWHLVKSILTTKNQPSQGCQGLPRG